MPPAILLLREPAVTSLASIVEKSHRQKPPLPEYDLRLNSSQLDFVLLSKPVICQPKISSSDEGFESDVDTISIVSSDDSFSSGNIPERNLKLQETDSGNGSASSDSSDTETSPSQTISSKVETTTNNESYLLVDCMCYTDIKFPNILVFVIKGDALVFSFKVLGNLEKFYSNFSTFKAIANQKAYSKTLGPKFNLLQRTDNNGITHIQVTKEHDTRLTLPRNHESNIISINTPEIKSNLFSKNVKKHVTKESLHSSQSLNRNINLKSNNPLTFNNKESNPTIKDANLRQQSESSTIYDSRFRKECNNVNDSHSLKARRSSSTENILNLQDYTKTLLKPEQFQLDNQENVLKKVWNSAEDLLDAPKRPERKRKVKSRAPPPPSNKLQQDVLRGQYVRVNVTSSDTKILDNKINRPKDKFQNMIHSKEYSANFKPIEIKYQQFKYVEPKRIKGYNDGEQHRYPMESSWTNSIPRFLRKPRSQSETRNFTPMAYRYIDTTSNSEYIGGKIDSNSVSNRLFGMSSKLKDFNTNGSNTINKKCDNWENRNGARRSSLGELTYKINSGEGSLKSVIKKDDNKRRNNDKKVTFSAYTTVQVV